MSLIHKEDYIHGYCHLSNILWERDGGIGKLKWIDPERMCNMARMDAYTKAVLKLKDTYHVLMHCAFFIRETSPAMTYEAFEKLDCEKLNKRLHKIKNSLSTDKQDKFYLPGTTPFHSTMRFTDASNQDIDFLKSKNPTQYEKMKTVDLTVFLTILSSDPVIFVLPLNT